MRNFSKKIKEETLGEKRKMGNCLKPTNKNTNK